MLKINQNKLMSVFVEAFSRMYCRY